MVLLCSLTSPIPIHITICSACECVCAFWLWKTKHHITNQLCDNNLLMRRWTPSPMPIRHTAFILHQVESPGMLTVKPFPSLARGHMHVQFGRTYSSNAGLPYTLLCQLIPKGVWAESNDPLWQPSHTAATPLIFQWEAMQAEGQQGTLQSTIHKVLS